MKNLNSIVKVAKKEQVADLVIKNGKIYNPFLNDFICGDVAVVDGYIAGVGIGYQGKKTIDIGGNIICAPYIDSHLHIESSLLTPYEFAKENAKHGTSTVLCDPHEIANVMGVDGIKYMIEGSKDLPIDIYFMLPSCVPSTPLDESGYTLNDSEIKELYSLDSVKGLAEMMNFVGVINCDKNVLDKIDRANSLNKLIDGHAPNLSGDDLNAYVGVGVMSEHEAYTFSEGEEKIKAGQIVMIREGTAAKNLQALYPLIDKYTDRLLFATDDLHPLDLLTGGDIDRIVKKAVKLGAKLNNTLKIATFNGARYLGLTNEGAIAPGYKANFIVLDKDLNVLSFYKDGKEYLGEVKKPEIDKQLIVKSHNTFNLQKVKSSDLAVSGERGLIGLLSGEIVTENLGKADKIDEQNDILKICVVERHHNTGHIGIGYIKGYGIKGGAVATSISHDSHNIIAVGVSDELIAKAINLVIDKKGGIAVVTNDEEECLQLEVAGLMTERPIKEVNAQLEKLKEFAYQKGVNKGIDPFMSLSFTALPVIPHLKITTQGVFDVDKFEYLK